MYFLDVIPFCCLPYLSPPVVCCAIGEQDPEGWLFTNDTSCCSEPEPLWENPAAEERQLPAPHVVALLSVGCHRRRGPDCKLFSRFLCSSNTELFSPCAPLSPEHRWLPPTRAGLVHVATWLIQHRRCGGMSASLLLPPGAPEPTQRAQYRNPTQPRAQHGQRVGTVLSHVRPTPGAESPRASSSKRGDRSTTPAQKLGPPRAADRKLPTPTGSRRPEGPWRWDAPIVPGNAEHCLPGRPSPGSPFTCYAWLTSLDL